MSEESSEDLGCRLNVVASGSGPLLVVELWIPSREGSEAGLLCEVGLRLIISVLGVVRSGGQVDLCSTCL